jgi:hypothetical protein
MKYVTPALFPSGRLKFGTRPTLIGSLPLPNTIGIVVVAALAAIPLLAVRMQMVFFEVQ